jgi:hypothetical protein
MAKPSEGLPEGESGAQPKRRPLDRSRDPAILRPSLHRRRSFKAEPVFALAVAIYLVVRLDRRGKASDGRVE